MAPLCRVMPTIQWFVALRASQSGPPVRAYGSTMTLAGTAWVALWPFRPSYRRFQDIGVPAYAMFLFQNYRNPIIDGSDVANVVFNPGTEFSSTSEEEELTAEAVLAFRQFLRERHDPQAD